MDTNTTWEQIPTSEGLFHYLRDTHKVFSRLFEGELIYKVMPTGQTPGANDGGYGSISVAIKVKGLTWTS